MSNKTESSARKSTEANRWENEGGASEAYANALPDGITTRLVREYMVGTYRYTDLQLAIAERDRQKALHVD